MKHRTAHSAWPSTLVRMGGLLAAILAAALLVLASPSAAGAGATDSCNVADFRNPDGSFDQTGYLACLSGSTGPSSVRGASVEPTTTTGALPRTGNDTGRYVALGAGLILVGAVIVFTTMRSRREPTGEPR